MKVKCERNKVDELLAEADRRLDILGIAPDNFAEQLRSAIKRKEVELLK